ncbi:sodium:solute symporter family protein [Tepidicella baoligensis]|uniref:sodium:solute symporter family protein n=1 Tax=Tepidicella baoligensis TaxID=2707016 RepID=UPI001C5C9BEF|nr:sodium:solute symporter family protein [Tepidicella baoligensis]
MAHDMTPQAQQVFRRQLDRVYLWFTGAFFLFVGVLAVLEQLGLPREWIGMIFLLATIGVYAAIGIMSRTIDPVEYYVAGRRVPAVYNGMATGADWMSAASFIGLAGTLYVHGYSGLAYVLGWTGGYCLVALLLAPYLRRFGQFTIPDFLGERYGGHWPRLLGIGAAILCSFIYVVAQIYGVGLITSRLTGVAFEVGVFLGLGGILVCSFLGGMRAVTWTQVAQYIVLIIAYMLPVVWLSIKQTGFPIPQLIYGQQLQKITERERELTEDEAEIQVRMIYQHQAGILEDKLQDPGAALLHDRQMAERHLDALRDFNGMASEIAEAEKALSRMPRDEASARELWTRQLAEAQAKSKPLNGMQPHAQPFAGDPHGSPEERQIFTESRRNFLALVFCLMLGTAALPHILMRYYTVPDVRQARQSVTWSLLFIGLLYFTAPALAVLVKFEVFNVLVGTPFDQLPAWVAAWSRVDADLLRVQDVNLDGILQLNEISIGADIIVLATAEIAGLPYVIAGLVAAGGLAAALSTADGLLLTIANALSHDLYYKMIDPNAATARRVTISKVLLLMVALAAAYVAAQKPADILFLVSSAFSIAAAAFFPALVLGIFWKRTTAVAAVAGMISGLGVTFYYMVLNQPWLRSAFGVTAPIDLWWGIQPVSAGVFGVPVGFAVMVLVSLLTPRPPAHVQALVEYVRGGSRLPPRWEEPSSGGERHRS